MVNTHLRLEHFIGGFNIFGKGQINRRGAERCGGSVEGTIPEIIDKIYDNGNGQQKSEHV